MPPTRPGSPPRPLYRSSVKSATRPSDQHTSQVTRALLVTVPAVLAAALLRPRSGSRRNR
ncbi:hypothetical protein ABZ951_20680 [Streptomyces sp. NPDC046215]|uniref:hypothetical protein n=1 Tax=Streptomyces TaxID=1883 RepID=UPI0031CF903C